VIAIPLFDIKDCLSPGLKINVLRNKSEAVLDNMGAKQAEKKIISSVAALDKGAHEPERFVPAHGLEGLKPETPFIPVIDSASADGYSEENGMIFYSVSMTVSPATPVAGDASAVAIEMRNGKPVKVAEEKIRVDGGRKISFKIPAASFDAKDLKVELLSAGGRDCLSGAPVKNTASLEAIKPVVSYLSYYSAAENVRLKIQLGLPKARLAKSALEITCGGKSILRKSGLSSDMTLAFPADGLPDGVSALEISLLTDGRKTASRTISVTRCQTPAPANARINNFDRVMMKDGKPFFPYGIFLASNPPPEDGSLFKFLSSDIGMNTVIRSHNFDKKVSPEWLDAWMKSAQKHNLSVIDWGRPGGSAGAQDEAGAKKMFDSVAEEITAEALMLSKSPNFLMWYNVDEPNLPPSDIRIKVAGWFYKTVRASDRLSPVNLLYAKHIPAGDNWTRWCDVLMYDIYANPDTSGFFGDPGLMMSHYTYMLEERAARDGKVTMIVPVSGSLGPPRGPVALTKQQQLCQSYAAVIYGAKGLLYFMDMTVCSPEHWDAFRELGRHLKELAPAITAPRVSQDISYSPGRFIPESRVFPMVSAAVFRLPEGGFVMLAVNIMPFAVKTALTIDGLKSAAAMFDGKDKVSISGNTLSDKMEPFGVRAYSLSLGASEPVKVSALMEAIENEKALPAAVPVSRIISQVKAGKNFMPNPVFARHKIEGLPDFVAPYMIYFPCSRENPLWFIDTKNKWSGHNSFCMRSETVPWGGQPKYIGMALDFYPPDSKTPENYVFSFYAKAEREGNSVTVHIDKTTRAFTLTRDWKRHSVSALLAPPDSLGGLIRISRPSINDSPVWISGLQMERGTEPSEFTDNSVTADVKSGEGENNGNLVANGGAESGDSASWTGSGLRVVSGAGAHSGNCCFGGKNTGYSMFTSDLIAVDSRKIYKLSGWFKNTGGKKASLHFGLVPFDAERQRIAISNLLGLPGTETELTEPCAPGDMSVKVRDASKWRTGPDVRAAFEPERGLPNLKASPLGVKNIVKSGVGWEIILGAPCGVSCPAGAKVRENTQSGGAAPPCLYPVKNGPDIKSDWTLFEGAVKGQADGPSADKFWPGTKFVKIVITLPNGSDSVLFDDISLREIN
jgi:hypothetical protein